MARLLDDTYGGGLLGNPLFNLGAGVLAASSKPYQTLGGALRQGALLGVQNLQQAQMLAARNKYLNAETSKLDMANQMAQRKMALLDNISKMGAGAPMQPGAAGQDPFLAELDRKYAIARAYEAVDPTGSANLFKEAAAQDPRLKLQNTMAGNMMVQTPSGWQFAPGVVGAQAGKEGAIEGAKSAADLPYVGPKAAATAAAQLPYQQQMSTFNADQDIRKSLLSPREVPPGGSLVIPANAGEIYRSPNPAPGTQQGKFQGGIGELQSKTVEGWHSDAVAAANQNATIGQMRAQLDAGLKTGPAFDTRSYISNVLTSLGADPTKIAGLPDATQATLFNKGVKEMLIDRAKAFGANPSNAEDRRVESALANANDPTEATKAFLDWMEKRNNTKIQKFEDGMTSTFDENGNVKGDPLRFDLEWAKKYGQTGLGTSSTAADRDASRPTKKLDPATKSAAQNAIMKGADRAAVKKRLQDNGYDVSAF